MITGDHRIIGSAICDHMETRICDRLRSIAIVRSQKIEASYISCDRLSPQQSYRNTTAIQPSRLRSKLNPIILVIDPIIQRSITTAPCLLLRTFLTNDAELTEINSVWIWKRCSAKLDWPNLHIAHRPNLRMTPSPPIDPRSSISDCLAAKPGPRPPCCFIFAYAYVL